MLLWSSCQYEVAFGQKVKLADVVDIEAEDGLFSNKKRRQADASILYEMSY